MLKTERSRARPGRKAGAVRRAVHLRLRGQRPLIRRVHDGEGAQQQLFANRYAAREDGQPALFPLENEQEYQIIRHCFEELKAKLAEQAAAQEGEAKA